MSVKFFKSFIQIQQETEQERLRRWPDWIRMPKLKNIRLSIKDRLARVVRGSLNGGRQLNLQPVRIRTGNFHNA